MVWTMTNLQRWTGAVLAGAWCAFGLFWALSPDEVASAGPRTLSQCAEMWGGGVRAESAVFYAFRANVYDPTDPNDPRHGTPEGDRLADFLLDTRGRALVDRMSDGCRSEVR